MKMAIIAMLALAIGVGVLVAGYDTKAQAIAECDAKTTNFFPPEEYSSIEFQRYFRACVQASGYEFSWADARCSSNRGANDQACYRFQIVSLFKH